MQKKIVFDARMYGLKHAGIGRYVMNLLKNLRFRISDFNFFLLVQKNDLNNIKQDLGKKFEYVPIHAQHYSFLEQIEIPLVLNRLNPDLVHFPHFNAPIFYKKNFIVTIHDLIKHYYHAPETTTKNKLVHKFKYWAYKTQIIHSVLKSKKVIVPSNFWRDKISKLYPVTKRKIKTTYEAVDQSFIELAKKQPLLKTQNFIIYTGSVYPHKNLKNLLLALKEIPDLELRIACSRNIFISRLEKYVRKLNLDSRVKFLGFVPDKDLIKLYKKSLALIQPSFIEGFGLTGLEAMSAECPVLSSNASCLPEIYGSAALYFNPNKPLDIARKIKKLTKSQRLRKKLIKLGTKQAQKYSWQKTAEQTLSVYKKTI